ncbi:MAG: type III-B CRISPR module RAMP protein Cmr4, partial [Pseudomonadota bacterium]|nr:type III-B CRISPR module RAMP protein Cmr4 [Pseudomonadota bacterium]
MTQANALLGLLTETALHAGAGSSVGSIDLPIQREAHSDWPCVYGSAVKGALRARAEDLKEDLKMESSKIEAIFGPDTRNADDHAGALAVGDARLLLLPVRSLTGHYRWVTCPALLRRLQRDAARLSVTLGKVSVPEKVGMNQALTPAYEGDLLLEEYRLKAVKADLDSLLESLFRLMDDGENLELLHSQLAVVSDDLFADLVRFHMPVAAHVRIDNETKTVKERALWYEESLPPDTLLYV